MNNIHLKKNAALKNIRNFIGELDAPSRYLLFSGIIAFVSLLIIFLFLLPSVYKLRNISNAVNIEKGNLNYVNRYAKRINSLRTLTLNARPQAAPATKNKKAGYIKSVYSMLDYFKIKKSDIEKLTGSYLKGTAPKGKGPKGQNAQKEDVSLVLRGLTLNELVNIIYGLSVSDYHVKFTSIKLHKNFNDKKLLNLNLSLERKIAAPNSNSTGTDKNVKNNKKQ